VTCLVRVAECRTVAVGVQLLLCLSHECIQASLHVRQLLPDVVHEHLVERLREVLSPVLVRDTAVSGMRAEELHFCVTGVSQGLANVDVLLGAVDDPDEAELERVHTSCEDVQCVGACIHQVELRQNANGAPALRVNLPSQLERLGVGEVDVRRRHGEDDAGWVLSDDPVA
jgi:hypothetical protein